MSQNSSSNENSNLISRSPPPVNRDTRPENSSSGVVGSFWNVCQIAHGVGETLRGTILGAIDDLEHNGERRHHEIARQGQVEIYQAYQRLFGTTGGADTQPTTTSHATGYEAAPPSYHATGTGYGTGVTHRDSKAGGSGT